MLTPVEFDWFGKWQETKWMKRGPEYEALKESFKQRMLEVLYQRWPQTKGHVKHAELSTPVSARHFASHPKGELYGLSQGPDRFQARIAARTKVRGLYLTGADVCMAGVSGALAGGVITASSIMGLRWMQLLMRKKVRRR
jgi:phytoene dehydrogenase-like protein